MPSLGSNGNSSTIGPKIDIRKIGAHLCGAGAAIGGIAIAQGAKPIEAPAFDPAIGEQGTGGTTAGSQLDDGSRGAG